MLVVVRVLPLRFSLDYSNSCFFWFTMSVRHNVWYVHASERYDIFVLFDVIGSQWFDLKRLQDMISSFLFVFLHGGKFAGPNRKHTVHGLIGNARFVSKEHYGRAGGDTDACADVVCLVA